MALTVVSLWRHTSCHTSRSGSPVPGAGSVQFRKTMFRKDLREIYMTMVGINGLLAQQLLRS